MAAAAAAAKHGNCQCQKSGSGSSSRRRPRLLPANCSAVPAVRPILLDVYSKSLAIDFHPLAAF